MKAGDNLHYAGTKVLFEIDSTLINYSNGIVEEFISRSGIEKRSEPKVLDFGAGTGFLAKIWRNRTGIAPHCLEVDKYLCSLLKTYGFHAVQNITELSGEYDLIYTSNVLEHIKDDEAAVLQLRNLLKDDGVLAIYVPAFQILFTEFDRNLGHFRRYTRKELNLKLEKNGFQVSHSTYSDSIGFLSIFFLKLIKFNFARASSIRFMMNIYDNFLLPISNFFDHVGCKFLFGKNLLVLAKKISVDSNH